MKTTFTPEFKVGVGTYRYRFESSLEQVADPLMDAIGASGLRAALNKVRNQLAEIAGNKEIVNGKRRV